ncbi:sigma-54-dependent Fis family transcriptional regulator [Shinella sp. G-2]|uniref:sigma-54-dependent Fis family transcriptional regulator n=1 Tax=Shinella sp. G-2 TaxID=3133141 RepID=UPI003D02B294
MSATTNHSKTIISAIGQSGRLHGANQPHLSRVVASWERCVERYGLDPYRVAFPTIVTQNELKSYQEQVEDLIAVAMPEVERLFTRFVAHDYIVSLTDGRGVTVLFRSQNPSGGKCADSGLILGAIWSEELQGTNGIGTCLAEAKPVSIVMDNHFDERLVDFSCTVAPIFGGGGKVAAALNLSTGRPSDHSVQAIVSEVVRRAARRIENRFFARRNTGRELLRVSQYEDFSDVGDEMRMALDPSGRIVDATPDVLRFMSRKNTALIGQSLMDVTGAGRNVFSSGDSAAIEVNGNRFFIRLADSDKRPALAATSSRVLPKTASATPDLKVLVGDDPAIMLQVARMQKLVDRRLPVLLQGETGAGKTALAKALHQAGAWSKGPFVSINCAAIPPELIESELFGYRPGAFTGASRHGSKGRIAEADGGTLFLDEIGDMPLALQTRLLQVLSDGEFVAVGATEQTRVQFSLISASLHDIPKLVDEGRFRQDLFFRLSGATLSVPPLRARSDKHAVVERFLLREAAEAGIPDANIDPAVLKILLAYPWPGNIRELKHVARFAATLAETATISVRDLPPPFNANGTGAVDAAGDERRIIELALQQSGWNVKLTAQRLGISRATLHRRIAALGLIRMASAP